MHPGAALALLKDLVAEHPVSVDADDIGGALVLVVRDLPHLEADALNDRLHAWAKRDVEAVLPHASAFVSFRHARPASLEPAEGGVQEEWVGLEPTFRLELEKPAASEADVRRFAALVPEFLSRVGGSGRPVGWRDVDVGNAE